MSGGSAADAAFAVAEAAAHAAMPMVAAAAAPLEARLAALEDHLTGQLPASLPSAFHSLFLDFVQRVFPHEAQAFRDALTPPATAG